MRISTVCLVARLPVTSIRIKELIMRNELNDLVAELRVASFQASLQKIPRTHQILLGSLF